MINGTLGNLETPEDVAQALSEAIGFQVHVRQQAPKPRKWAFICHAIELNASIEFEPGDTVEDIYSTAHKLCREYLDRKSVDTPGIHARAESAREDRKLAQANKDLTDLVKEQRTVMAGMREELRQLRAEREEYRQLSGKSEEIQDAEFEEVDDGN